MRNKLPIAAILIATAVVVAGCGKSNSPSQPGTSTNGVEQASVSATLANTPQVIEDGQFESTDVTDASAPMPAGATAAITPLRFWRVITGVQRSFEFAFADTDSTGRPTTAVVTVHKLLTGRFNILTGTPGTDSTGMDSSLFVVHKPLEDHWVRRILLKRVRDVEDAEARWRVVATSGVKVTSKDAATRIQSLRVQSGGLDTTITDPLAFNFLRRILKLDAGAQVTLTVTTLRNDDVVVLMLRDHRFRFHDNGDDTYTGTFVAADLDGEGLRHFGVNALSHGTLFDDAAAYDSQAWIMPYVVTPTEMAAELP